MGSCSHPPCPLIRKVLLGNGWRRGYASVRLLRDEAFWAGYQTSSVTEDPPGGLLILSRWPLLEVVEPGLPLLSRWNDAWTLLHPQQAGYTYDLARNPRAREQAFPKELSRRLDRVLLTPGLRPKAMGFVGEGASGATPPSDHYGLWVELRLPSGG